MKMKKKSVCLVVSVLATFLVCEIVVCCLPKIYQSSFVISLNTEEQDEKTIDMKSAYSLGLHQTHTYWSSASVGEIIHSDAFLHQLLQTEVSTLDNAYCGSLKDYLSFHQKGIIGLQQFSTKDEQKPVSCDESWYSKSEVSLFHDLRSMLKSEVEYETQFVTVTCKAQDPKVATLIARHTEALLQNELVRYEKQKRESVLSQLARQIEIADAQLAQARETKSANVSECQQVAESFRRQKIVYEAQVQPTRIFLTLSAPTVEYRKVSPSRIKVPMVVTCLVGLLLLGWWERRRIVAFFQEK